jgi:hypothetical protein
VRPSGQGGCDKWGGAGRKYKDEPPAKPGTPLKSEPVAGGPM